MDIEKLKSVESNTSKVKVETNVELKTAKVLDVKPNENEVKKISNIKKISLETKMQILVCVVIILGLLIAYFIQNRNYYNNIPVILNANDFVNARQEDIINTYGQPDENKNNENYIYYFDDYKLEVKINDYYVQWVGITPYETITYEKSHKEIFYMLGIGEDYNNYTLDSNYDYVGDGGIKTISLMTYIDENDRLQTMNEVEDIFIIYRTDYLYK